MENPRYAVVVMVVEAALPADWTCAPLAHEVYLAIQQKEQRSASRPPPLAEIQK